MNEKPLNVLVAYDGSEPSRRALDRVRTLMPDAAVAVATVAAPDALADTSERAQRPRGRESLRLLDCFEAHLRAINAASALERLC